MVELFVSWVINKGRAIDGILRVEQVRVGRVVNDYSPRQLTIQQAQVLYIASLVVHA